MYRKLKKNLLSDSSIPFVLPSDVNSNFKNVRDILHIEVSCFRLAVDWSCSSVGHISDIIATHVLDRVIGFLVVWIFFFFFLRSIWLENFKSKHRRCERQLSRWVRDTTEVTLRHICWFIFSCLNISNRLPNWLSRDEFLDTLRLKCHRASIPLFLSFQWRTWNWLWVSHDPLLIIITELFHLK